VAMLSMLLIPVFPQLKAEIDKVVASVAAERKNVVDRVNQTPVGRMSQTMGRVSQRYKGLGPGLVTPVVSLRSTLDAPSGR
jgi:hypothetical protein